MVGPLQHSIYREEAVAVRRLRPAPFPALPGPPPLERGRTPAPAASGSHSGGEGIVKGQNNGAKSFRVAAVKEVEIQKKNSFFSFQGPGFLHLIFELIGSSIPTPDLQMGLEILVDLVPPHLRDYRRAGDKSGAIVVLDVRIVDGLGLHVAAVNE